MNEQIAGNLVMHDGDVLAWLNDRTSDSYIVCTRDDISKASRRHSAGPDWTCRSWPLLRTWCPSP